jgi:hypothetical protein
MFVGFVRGLASPRFVAAEAPARLSFAPRAEWHREYYREDGGGTSRVRAVVCLVVQSARGLSQHLRVFPNVN